MKAPQSSQKASVMPNMTPMIDVVFLLIIFFLVSSHLAKQETRMPLDLPAATTHQSNDDANHQLTINVTQNGDFQVGGTTVTSSRISSLLIEHINQHASQAAVRIRTDRTVRYGVIGTLLRDVALAGVTDVSFAVNEAP